MTRLSECPQVNANICQIMSYAGLSPIACEKIAWRIGTCCVDVDT